jgi:uncharacterized membrane protein
MSLRVAHQVFIASVIALLALCVLWEVNAYQNTGDGWTLLYALGVAAMGVALSLYLRGLRRRGRMSPYRRNQPTRE